MNILIVDDSSIIRRVLKNSVSRYFTLESRGGCEVFEAENGEEALKKLEQQEIDLMLLDWNMPIMNGEAVVDSVRAKKEYNKIRIIMATTEGSKANVLKMIKKGVNGYIVKPFVEEAIFKALDTVTARMAK